MDIKAMFQIIEEAMKKAGEGCVDDGLLSADRWAELFLEYLPEGYKLIMRGEYAPCITLSEEPENTWEELYTHNLLVKLIRTDGPEVYVASVDHMWIKENVEGVLREVYGVIGLGIPADMFLALCRLGKDRL